MKVSQLIKKLQKFDPELEVFMIEYEGGYEPVGIIKKGYLKHDRIAPAPWWCGEYEMSRNNKKKKGFDESVIIATEKTGIEESR